MKEISAPTKIIKEAVGIFFQKENFSYFLQIGFISLLLTAIQTIPNYMNNFGNGFNEEHLQYLSSNYLQMTITVILFVVLAIVSLWSQVSNYEALKRAVEKRGLEFSDTFRSSWKYIWPFFLVSLLTGLAIVFGLVLLIIPGLILSVLYAFAIFPVFEGKGVIESIKISREIARGRFWKLVYRLAAITLVVFLVNIILSLIPYNIGSLISALFGGLYLLPFYLLYLEVKTN